MPAHSIIKSIMKKIFLYLLLLALLGAAVGYYLWNKPHQNIQAASVDANVTAAQLFAAFEQDEAKANEKYLDKIIQVSGRIADSSTGTEGQIKITLESDDPLFGVICELDPLSEHKRTSFLPGETILLKGKCTGKLMDVVLVRCVEP